MLSVLRTANCSKQPLRWRPSLTCFGMCHRPCHRPFACHSPMLCSCRVPFGPSVEIARHWISDLHLLLIVPCFLTYSHLFLLLSSSHCNRGRPARHQTRHGQSQALRRLDEQHSDAILRRDASLRAALAAHHMRPERPSDWNVRKPTGVKAQ